MDSRPDHVSRSFQCILVALVLLAVAASGCSKPSAPPDPAPDPAPVAEASSELAAPAQRTVVIAPLVSGVTQCPSGVAPSGLTQECRQLTVNCGAAPAMDVRVRTYVPAAAPTNGRIEVFFSGSHGTGYDPDLDLVAADLSRQGYRTVQAAFVAPTVTADPVTDTITWPAHPLAVGNQVRFKANLSMPAPMIADAPYVVFSTQLDSVQIQGLTAGTLLDITTAGQAVSAVMGWQAVLANDVSTASCRGREVLDWVMNTWGNHGAGATMCGVGMSGGAALLGYAMAYHGASTILRHVFFVNGPSHTRMDCGCAPTSCSPTGRAPNLCGGIPDGTMFGDLALADVWAGTSSCGSPTPDAGDLVRWQDQSVLASNGAVVDYPNTSLSFGWCSSPHTAAGQGSLYSSEVTGMAETVHCQACTGEAFLKTAAGRDTVVQDVVANCQ